MRDRLKLPRAFIALILAEFAENCLRTVPRAAKIRRIEWRSH